MIATISLADVHYEETLSTLRFADRMKSIKTAPIMNESATKQMIRTIRSENELLLGTLERGALEGAADEVI
uniref:Kinesin motor domain-containing protein n=1 Tax=Globodera pallida TaxID=36090 RepID=A0A183CQW4_GLOPA